MKAFAEAHGITFPLLSDAGSEVIKRYGLLNAQATGRTAGIPYPGTFVLDTKGEVLSRSFEAAYQERASASSLLSDRRTAGTAAETGHIAVTASASDELVAPGMRFSLFVDIAPKPNMHVYAPAKQPYIPVSLAFAESDMLRLHEPVFPPAETYLFKPLNERQSVYSKPFRILQSVTIPVTTATRERARAEGSLEIRATLHYQACDDKVCYRPMELPLVWTVRLGPLIR